MKQAAHTAGRTPRRPILQVLPITTAEQCQATASHPGQSARAASVFTEDDGDARRGIAARISVIRQNPHHVILPNRGKNQVKWAGPPQPLFVVTRKSQQGRQSPFVWM